MANRIAAQVIGGPLSDRARRQEQAARELRASTDRHDVTQTMIAEACSQTQSKVAAWMDPTRRESPAAHDLIAMDGACSPVAVDLLRPIALAHGYALTQVPIASGVPQLELTMLAELAKEQAEAVAATATALKDPSRANLATLLREATEALEKTASLVHATREAMAARVVLPIRGAQ